jgi:hypothetical protein
MSGRAAFVLAPEEVLIGQGDVAVPSRVLYGYDRFVKELSDRLDEAVSVREVADGDPLPSGLLLLPMTQSVARLTQLHPSEADSIARRVIVLHVLHGDLQATLLRFPVAAAIAETRWFEWESGGGDPYPWTVYVRRDIQSQIAAEIDARAPVVPLHVALDPTGLAPLPMLVAEIARAWLTSTSQLEP